MRRLIRSLVDFHSNVAPPLKALFAERAASQNPEVLLVTCSDSRVVPHLFSSAEPGEVFVVRTVGNLVSPADETGKGVGDVSEASAIEYAVEVLGIRDIAVCGHSNCGAMRAVKDGREKYRAVAPNLTDWLVHAEPSLARSDAVPAGTKPEDALAMRNVLQQLQHIATYAPVRRRGAEVRLHGLFFDIASARVLLFEADKGAFVPLDEAEVTRLLGT